MFLLRLLYKPFAIMGAIIAGKLGQSIFRSIWAKIDEEPPPRPGTGEASTLKVVTAQALQAGVMAGTAAAVDRTFARFYHHLIGIWPKKPPEPDED
ncbi:MAG TPA: DUF4235 domain-containing protein [Solirubrobacteraceae bacterium]|jgi:hypothetical protein